MRYWIFFALTLLALVGVHPVSAQQRNSAPIPGRDTLALEEYRIGPEDVLAISVWKNEPMSKIVPVRPDGMISLPLLDDVRAAGLTPMQLRDLLAQKLAEYVPSPSVSVIVNEVKSFKVSVLGEVQRPARYELKSRTTVLDVLALAGGFNQFAARTRIVIIRQEGDKRQRLAFNYNKVVAGGAEDENYFLKPNDIVLVP
jgi:polysaccharide export outer membrane protein